MTSVYSLKLLVVTNHGSIEITKDKIEAFTTWLEKVFLEVINTRKIVPCIINIRISLYMKAT